MQKTIPIIKNLFKQKSIISFVAASLLLALFSRSFFLISSFQNNMDSVLNRVVALSLGLSSDIFVISVFAFTFYLFHFIFFRYQNVKKNKIFNFIFQFILAASYFSIAVLFLVNQKLYNSLFIEINYTLLQAYFQQGKSAVSLIYFISPAEWIMLFIAVVIYIAMQFSGLKHIKILSFYFILPIYLLLLVFSSTIYTNSHILAPGKRFMILFTNPVINVAKTYYKSFNPYNNARIEISDNQLQSTPLIDPIFLSKNFTKPDLQVNEKNHHKQWNIIFFVLESVGANYIFDNKISNVPMPFLKSLTAKSVWFENNYTGGNISALGQFSILTGLYPNPTPSHFEMSDKLKIPTISNWLGKNYDSFFISSSNDLYFAKKINETFSDYENSNTIKSNAELFYNMFLDEKIGFQFFLKRLNHSRSPFVAVYWSGAAHYPYKDYSQYTSVTDNTFYPYQRYLNSLKLLDDEIKQLYVNLKEKKLLDNTILIVVGDHGEIFGQHENLWVHGQSLFQEEIKVPLLMFAPSLFKATSIHQITSSVDIVPTLLAAINKSPARKFQGESLLSHQLNRKYIFIYNDNDEIAAINQNNIKMRISFANNTCVTYNLTSDPKEFSPLPCTDPMQKMAILKFRYYQPRLLERLNNARSPFES